MTKYLKAVGDRAIVKITNTKKLASGLVLPDGTRLYQNWADVLDPGVLKGVRVGDRVWVISNMAQAIEGHEDVFWIHKDHVCAVEREGIPHAPSAKDN